jgi:hypothetical protein
MSEYSTARGGGDGRVVAAFLLAAAFIVCTVIGTRAFVRVKGFGQTIAVTGSASKPIRSNRALWEGAVAVSAASVEEAYAALKSDLALAEQFLAKEGLQQTQYELGTVQISKTINREGMLTGYNLRQSVKVAMDNVDRVTDLSKNSAALVEAGVEFYAERPRYLFTGLDALKIEMIKAAMENAQLRAQQIAEATGRNVGAPTAARVGVFQIRPQNSQEVSDMGMSDVTSIDKEIVSTVSVSFLFE